MMILRHCYCFSGIIIIITIYFSFLNHSTLASPGFHFCRHNQRDALLEFINEFPNDEYETDADQVQMGMAVGDEVSINEVLNDNVLNHDIFLYPDGSEWNKSNDCCHWAGVTCDDKYGQLISLDLTYTSLNGSLKTNSSLFKLQYLRHLTLADCDLKGVIPSSLGNLSSLTLVDLSFNNLIGQIPVSLEKLSRLTFVDLSFNNLVGKIPLSIGNLSRLTLINLSYNELVGEIPAVIGNLNHLRNLSLKYNHHTGVIPSSLGNLSHLIKLDLSINHLVGDVPASIGNIHKLRVIRLDNNSLSGKFPILSASFTKLFLFSLSYNNLESTLPSDMSGFHSLEYFDVSENSFFGPLPTSLFSITSLKYVDLGGNQFNGPIQFANTFSKIWYLDLSSNRLNGPTPESVSELLKLAVLDLSQNNFSGSIPRSISKLVNLADLQLSNNNLKGEVPGFVWGLSNLNLSHNSLESFGNSSKETMIMSLDLSSNSFQGPFPHRICKLNWDWDWDLYFLDLSNNLFNGSIPPCLRNSVLFIAVLMLSNNSFSGVIPDVFANATKLLSLDVSHNQLEGNFPKSLTNVESNRIKDKFPYWLGSLPSLHVLILRSNEFYGPLCHRHVSIGFQSLRVIFMFRITNSLELSHLTIFPTGMKQPRRVENRFEGIREDFRAIDFSGNRFYGKIPESIGFLKELHLLNLSNNAFTSCIPQSLANLTNLETLDLSSNKLSGQIPQDIGKLSFLSYMNFSHNLLQGPVPRGTQFQRQNCSSFSDNLGLYGLDEICVEPHIRNPTSQENEESLESEEPMFNWIAAAIAYGPGVFCGLMIGYIFTSHNQ
ncbi:hypothetical protein Bca4012_057581 [Brassica carinata]